MPLCKRLSTLTCKECGLNLCYDHAVRVCKPCCNGMCGEKFRHTLDGITATFCTVEVDSHE